MARILVVGGGPAGCAATHFMTRLGHDVTLIEKSNVLGGGGRTFYHGGHPYTFGPRHFLTRREEVWNYLNEFCPMKRYAGHRFITYIHKEKRFFHFPIHEDEIKLHSDADKIRQELAALKDNPPTVIPRNLEQFWLGSVGPTLYGKYVKTYTEKMWDGEPAFYVTDFAHTTKGVALKTGPDKAAWSEAFTGFPLARDGYNDYFDKVAVADAAVNLKTEIESYDMKRRSVKIRNDWYHYDIIISTIRPDVIFRGCFGALRWMGRDFLPLVLNIPHAFEPNVFFQYYAGTTEEEPFTRVVEYKQFYDWDYDSPTTLLGIEIPSKRNKLYPFPMKADQDKAQKYLNLFGHGTYSIGRMGSYRYLDFGDIIWQCMKLAEKIGRALNS